MEWVKIITEVLKFAPGTMFAIAITTFMLLVLPAGASTALGLQPIVNSYRGWLVISCFFSSLIAIFYGPLPWLARKKKQRDEARAAEVEAKQRRAGADYLARQSVLNRLQEQRDATAKAGADAAQLKAGRKQKLKLLPAHEKRVVYTYMQFGTGVMNFKITDALANSLVGRGVLAFPSGAFDLLHAPFSMHPWVIEILWESPELLDGRIEGVYCRAGLD